MVQREVWNITNKTFQRSHKAPLRGRALSRGNYFSLHPCTNHFLILLGESSLRVHRGVLPGRHSARRDKSANRLQFVLFLPLRIRVPLREIQPFPAFTHVPSDPPRKWRKIAVPRPVCVVGVAVPTTPHQNLGRFGVEQSRRPMTTRFDWGVMLRSNFSQDQSHCRQRTN